MLKGAIKMRFRHKPHLHLRIRKRREGSSKIIAIGDGGGEVVHEAT